MAQLRTVPLRWLWHRDLRPCAPGHFGLLHKKPERFHIQTIMWLEIPLPHTDYYVTWSSAVPLPHMDYSLAWSSVVSLPHKEYTMSRSSAVLLSQTDNLWLEVPQFRTIYCDLNFRSSVSARKDVIWNSAGLLLHENITFLWKIHSHLTTYPFLNFRADLHDWWTEKQRNRDAPGKIRR